VANTDSFIDEVSEEVRNDRMFALWKKYGPYVIAVVVLIVLAAFAKTYWDRQQEIKKQERSAAYISAVNAETPAESASALEEFANGADDGYAAMAQLQAAAKFADEGNTDKATELYAKVSENAKLSMSYRDLASIKSVMLTMDTADPADLKSQLSSLMNDGAPYATLARELMAMVHMQAGESEDARVIFTELSQNPDISQGIRSRSTALLDILGGPVATIPDVAVEESDTAATE